MAAFTPQQQLSSSNRDLRVAKSLSQLLTGPLHLTPLIESHDEQGYAISGCLKLAQSEKQESLCFLRPVEENHRSLNVAIESLSLTRIFSLT